MNICLFSHNFLPFTGGMEYVIHHLANELVDQGHDVTVVVKRLSWVSPGARRAYRLKRYGAPVRGTGKLGIDYCSAVALVVFLHRHGRFDVLHCHDASYAGSRARKIAAVCNLPLVLTPHGIDIQKVPGLGYGLRLDKSWDKIITKNVRSADYVTAISESVRAELEGVSADRIVNVPNGIHVQRFSGPRSGYLRETLGIPAEKKIILSVGRNHIVKGYDRGIQAMSMLVRDLCFRDVHYVIVGRGVSEQQDWVDACHVSSSVSLIEEVTPDMITQCYHSADVFFSPSVMEGMSLVSIEAIAAGLPLVVTNVPGNEEVVKENDCGVIVQSENSEDMARGLFSLLNDDATRICFAERAKLSAGKYDWSEVAKQYAVVYEKAIKRRRGAGPLN